MKNSYLELARKAIGKHITTGQVLKPAPHLGSKKAGVFVSLHYHGTLRGCIGTFLPTQKNIAQEIIHNAISAAAQDPRFPPVTKKELANLEISVDILSKPKPAKKEALNPQKYGLIVSTADGRRGLLLPDIEGVDTVEDQISICRQKAGIAPGEKITLQTFTVQRYTA